MIRKILLVCLISLSLLPASFRAQEKIDIDKSSATYSTVLRGSVIYSNTWGGSSKRGIYSFPAASDTKLKEVNTAHGGLASYSGIYLNDKFYTFSILFGTEHTYYYRIFNGSTWTQDYFNSSEIAIKNLPSDLTYDPVSQKIFGVTYDSTSSTYRLCTFDLTNGQSTIIAEISIEVIAIAANKNGVLYAISSVGDLYTVNKENAAVTLIGSTTISPNNNMVQSAVFDDTLDKLYWSACLQGSINGLFEVNTSTGVASLVSYFPGNEQVTSLFVEKPLTSLSAPSVVEDLSLNFTAPGALTGKISFKAPIVNYGGSALSGTVGVKILAGGEEILAVDNLTPGQSYESSPITFSAGQADITAIAFNSEGNSPESELSLWIGHDVPEAVSDLTLTKDVSGKPKLSWIAPTKGKHNGYFDVAALKYKIVRNPEAVVVEENYSGTSYIDASIGNYLGIYSYTVIPVSAEGEGDSSSTEEMVFNEVYEVPYSETFETGTVLNVWTIINSNGGITWDWNSADKSMKYGSETQAADDWLISPPIELKKGAVYQIKYSYKAGLYIREENMKVTIGTSAEPTTHTTILGDHVGFKNQSSLNNEVLTFTAPEDGNYYLGFYAYSEGGKSGIYVDNIEVNILYATGTPAEVTDLEIVPGLEGALNATISMKAPLLTVADQALDVISAVDVYRGENKILVKYFLNPAPGADLTWEDSTPENGLNTYYIETYNEKGRGPVVTETVFIGEDVPSAVTELSVVDNDGDAVITWTSPATGKNEGYIKVEDLKYKIEREPGAVLVAENVTGTSFTDNTIETELGKYAYKVTASTTVGEGESLTSDYVFIGSGYSMPYKETFDTKAPMDYWTVLNLNGGSTWTWNSSKYVQYAYNNTLPGDDWLISPPFKMHEGYTYQIKYKTWSSMYYGSATEKLKVTMGSSLNPEDHTILLKDHTDIGNQQIVYTHEFVAPSSGKFHLGFYVYSPEKQYNLRVDDVEITVISASGVPTTVSNLSVTAGEQGALTAKVSFVSPSTTYSGTSLGGLTSIEIYRGDDNETPVHTFESPNMNAQLEWEDVEAVQGINTYRVIAYNEAGAGMEVAQEVFVGNDIPEAVEDLKLKDIDGIAVISWQPPVQSVNGGYFNPDELTYKVTRQPDNVVLTESLTLLTYSDESVSDGEQLVYFYTVESITPAGNGTIANTESKLFGASLPVPYFESFPETAAQKGTWMNERLHGEVAEWTVVDFGKFPNIPPKDEDGGLMSFNAFYSPSGETSRFISPKIDISTMNNPILSFYMYNFIDPGVPKEDRLQLEISINGEDFQEIAGAVYRLASNNNGWTEYKIVLLDYIESKYIQLGFRGISDRGNNIHIDDISIKDSYKFDLEAVSLNGPDQLDINDISVYKVNVKNNGATAVSDYKIHLYRDEELYDTIDGININPHSSVEAEFDIEATLDEVGKTYNYKVEIEYSLDEYTQNNNTETVSAKVMKPVYPVVNDLTAKPNGYDVNLTWSEPVAVYEESTEDFESYEAFTINKLGDWTLVDVDEEYTVSFPNIPDYPNKFMPMAFQVFNMSELNIQNPLPYSDDQMLACFSTSSTGGPNNDWLISPLLPGNSQKVSFYARSLNNNNPLERIIFRYSKAGKELAGFIKLNEGEYLEVPTTWTKYEFELPEGTTYFAIQCVSDHSYVLFVDYITFTKQDPSLDGLELIGYDIYRDGKKIAERSFDQTSYLDEGLEKGDYTYKVTALYNKGVSYYSNEVSANVDGVGLEHVNNDVKIFTMHNAIVVEGALGERVDVYSIDGKVVYTSIANATEYIYLDRGIYLVRVGEYTKKVILK